MSRFITRNELLPMHVDRELLIKLEDYFIKLIPDLVPDIPKSWRQNGYSMEVTDKYGTEKFDSIKEYDFKYLPDTINLIQIGFLNNEDELKISIILDKEEGAFLELDFEAANAREKASALLEGLNKILRNYKTVNSFYHPPSFIQAPIVIVGFIYGILSFAELSYRNYIEAIGPGLITLAIISYYYVGKKIRSIVSFETKRYQLFNHYLLWFISGSLSFLIFGTIFTYFKDKLLGLIK
ncbi:hypothetical protein L9Z41_17250 [Leptospira noguchii]|uniref:hypothetical protein n=1 Tax=Leptospira noguchii TaxID=28182 RepID=UPI001F060B68|nr:hypothetical protein [Leptospira noguchii]MCH1911851.1 hypothetical protein [Leptospira noguchii]MCH1917328.1 hypothetical protein [Leptospira noguchii]UOG63009.1 hypothetical protein MAL04_11385 [Leptospira noguchii]